VDGSLPIRKTASGMKCERSRSVEKAFLQINYDEVKILVEVKVNELPQDELLG